MGRLPSEEGGLASQKEEPEVTRERRSPHRNCSPRPVNAELKRRFCHVTDTGTPQLLIGPGEESLLCWWGQPGSVPPIRLWMSSLYTTEERERRNVSPSVLGEACRRTGPRGPPSLLLLGPESPEGSSWPQSSASPSRTPPAAPLFNDVICSLSKNGFSCPKSTIKKGAWGAQSVKRPTLDFSSDCDLTVCEIEPRTGVHTDGAEAAWDSLPLPLPCLCVHTLSLKISK